MLRLLIKGNVPGPKKSFVMIRTAVKKPTSKNEAKALISYKKEETPEVTVENTETVAE